MYDSMYRTKELFRFLTASLTKTSSGSETKRKGNIHLQLSVKKPHPSSEWDYSYSIKEHIIKNWLRRADGGMLGEMHTPHQSLTEQLCKTQLGFTSWNTGQQ